MKTIITTKELAQFCADAATSRFVTVDTEFHRETTYWPDLCLVQLAHDNDAALIDPLANGISLDPFFDLMQNENVLKVFHAARQDIEILVKLSGKVPTPLFDTQIAASVCGHGDSIAYDKLVAALTDGRIDKSSQFTDWRRRPLTEKQKHYALGDVTHLRDVFLALEHDLEKRNRIEWLANEMETLTDPATYILKPEDAYKRIKVRTNRPIDLATLIDLAAWREQKAQDENVPRGRILKDDAIGELAIQRPTDPAAFDRLRAVPKGFGRSRYGQDVIGIIQAINKRDKSTFPKIQKHRPGPSPKGAIGDLLRVLLKSVAEQEGVAPRIIASSDDINELVLNDQADIPALKGWRKKIFGQKALDLKHGKLALAATTEGLTEISLKQPRK